MTTRLAATITSTRAAAFATTRAAAFAGARTAACAAAFAAVAWAAPATDDDAAIAESVFTLPDEVTRLAVRDTDGDGRQELLVVGPRGVFLHALDAEGRFPADPDVHVPWPDPTLGWTLADLDGAGPGGTELLMLSGMHEVTAWHLTPTGATPRTLLEGVAAYLPRGIRRMDFVHDVDGDGAADLVLPGSGRYLIHLGNADGTFGAEPLEVLFAADVSLEVGDPDTLDGHFGQDVRVPFFRLRDIDGDGRSDLVSTTEDAVDVYLVGEELPGEPSWSLDLAALREQIEQPTSIDLDDLLSNLDFGVTWKTADLDGAPPLDLVVQRGPTFTIHDGGSRGPDMERPTQVLKAGGNVLHFLLRDVDGDGLADLQILRTETISLGRVLRWLIVSGSIDFEVFTYRNEGGSFARKPVSRKAISLRLPAILGFVDEAEDFGDELETKAQWPARRADFDGDGRQDDIVDVGDGRLTLFRDLVPADHGEGFDEQLRRVGVEDMVETYLIRALDGIEDGDTYAIELTELPQIVPLPAWELHETALSARPFAAHATLAELGTPRALQALDLDGDGRSDIIASYEGDKAGAVVQFLVFD